MKKNNAILSESNLETVYADGTVLDKRDGKRRKYDAHIAHCQPPTTTPIKTHQKLIGFTIGLIVATTSVGIADLVLRLVK